MIDITKKFILKQNIRDRILFYGLITYFHLLQHINCDFQIKEIFQKYYHLKIHCGWIKDES